MKEREKLNILLVDDKPENLVSLEAVLESPDLNIIKAMSGNEALSLMLKYDFALVLLDVQMPEMNGFETAALMRKSEKTKYIPIIFVTGIYKEENHIFKGYESGAVDYLFKPLDMDILRSKVNVFLELHRQKKLLAKTTGDLKQTVEELTKTKYHLDNIIESSLDGIIVTDPEGYITKTNNSFMKLLGYEKEELIGKHTAELSPAEDGIYECTTGRTVEIEIEPYVQSQIILMERLYEDGKIKNVVNYYVRKDKKLIPVEVNNVLLYNEKGDITGAVGINRDITERKKFEKELKMSEEKYRSLIENANDAIISSNEEGEIVGFNKKAEEIFGYTYEEILGKSVLMLSAPSRREEGRKGLEELRRKIKTGMLASASENEGLRKDGTLIPIESSLFAVEVEGEYIITSILREISARKEMEHKLLQSEKLKSLGELAGGVAHNFNNVLAAILGRAQLLKMIVETPQGKEERRKSVIEMKEGLEVIEKASRDGAETVRRIQEFASRRDDDKHFTTVDLNEIIDNALDFTRMKWKDDAESKGIKITIQKELSTLPTTSGSAAELREVLTNLINNAVDAMPQGGEINFKTYKEDGHIVVNVEDTGVGISESVRNRIFDPFFTTKGVQSTGLGMSVSYGIINRHRGTITVDSVAGKGTTFIIKLPISEKAVKEEKEEPISDEQKKARILVVEDEENVRDLLSAILTKGGHEVEIASDGSKGIKLFKKKEFDLVFTDLGMPGMSGWQVAEKIKSINKNVPVALITGWNVELKESEMRESGVDLIAYKPFEVKQVFKLVQDGMILKDRFKAA